jgi:hypothetical protein
MAAARVSIGMVLPRQPAERAAEITAGEMRLQAGAERVEHLQRLLLPRREPEARKRGQ